MSRRAKEVGVPLFESGPHTVGTVGEELEEELGSGGAGAVAIASSEVEKRAGGSRVLVGILRVVGVVGDARWERGNASALGEDVKVPVGVDAELDDAKGTTEEEDEIDAVDATTFASEVVGGVEEGFAGEGHEEGCFLGKGK